LGLVDKIISEPLGGAHRDYPAMMQTMRKSLQESLKQVTALSQDEMLQTRFTRLMSYGKYKEVEV
jgi:acetyl-CoA carboxylase carboxyl transferase subunit alpha